MYFLAIAQLFMKRNNILYPVVLVAYISPRTPTQTEITSNLFCCHNPVCAGVELIVISVVFLVPQNCITLFGSTAIYLIKY